MPPVPHPGTTSSGSLEPTSQGLGASDELPLFSQVDNQIHLRNGILLEQEKWAWLLSRASQEPLVSTTCARKTRHHPGGHSRLRDWRQSEMPSTRFIAEMLNDLNK
ncbi:hypothetical protein MRX96_001095 [Rhipicephalus microplus]